MLGRTVRRWTGAALAGFGGLVLSTAACNLIVKTDIEQCKTTDDCLAKGPEFADSVCTPDKVCSNGGDCNTNQECLDRNNGEPSICRRPEGTCVKLTTPDCVDVFPPNLLSDDQTIVLGSLGPLTGPDASSGVPTWEGVKLALNEIEVNTKGIPVRGSNTRRHVVVVACDDSKDSIGVAKHLAKTVRVPLIFGPSFSGVLLDVATKVTIPAGTLLVSASATSPQITGLQDNGLVWRTVPSDALQAIPIAQVVNDLETKIRADLSLQPSTKIRLAMTAKGDAYGLGLADAAQAKIQFNGLGASENGSNFLRRQYPDPSTEPGFDYTAIIDDIVAMNPHIIIPVGTTEAVTDILQKVEAKWTSTPRPWYSLTDGGKIQELLDFVKGKDELRQRVIGTAPGRETPQYNEFKSRFQSFLAHDPGTYAANSYDAAYLAAYALVATSDQFPTGAVMNEGLKTSVGGAKVTAGPNFLNTGFNALLVPGGKIDYDGVSGPLDFDVNTGEAPADIDIFCVNLDAGNPIFASSGQYYDAATGKVTGTFLSNCN